MFFSCIILDIDVSRKKIIYSSGGHLDQLVLKSNGEFISLPRTGVIVGFHKKSEFMEREIPFTKGDIVVLYTDGIIEEFNQTNQSYGEERFKESLTNSYSEGLQAMEKKINTDLQAFLGNQKPEDDITILLFQMQ